MENMYAVVDTTTRAILAFPNTQITAVYVSQGIVNSEPILIPTSLQTVGEDLEQYNLDTDVLIVQVCVLSFYRGEKGIGKCVDVLNSFLMSQIL